MVIPCNAPAEECNGIVKFVVGPVGDTWTIPGRREVLLNKSEVLTNILRNGETTVLLPDVDKRGFEYLLRHLEGTDPKFTLVQTARTTLDVAQKFQIVSLVQICVQYLDEHLNPTTVLSIYKNLLKYCDNSYSSEPCAPAFNATIPNASETTIQDLCSDLLHNCLLIIDQEAEEVLSREEIELLNKKDFAIIVSRESLNLKSELTLFDCLMRWYKCELMRLGNKMVNPTTRREILGSLIYKVRFGLLTRNQFLIGPGSANIFTSNETNEILAIIDNPSVLISQGPLMNTNIKREKINAEPQGLSCRTVSDRKKVKTKKNKEKPSNTLLNCLTIWTVLFD